MTDQQQPRGLADVPLGAAILGFLGAVPFVVLSVALWTDGLLPRLPFNPFLALTYYAAIILSFMGGVRWGLAMAAPDGPAFAQLLLSVTPALIAWAALVIMSMGLTLPYLATGLALLILSFLALLWSDLKASRTGLAPAWYPALRIPLTTLVTLSLSIALAGLL